MTDPRRMTATQVSDAPLTPAISAELMSELGFLHVPGPPLSADRAYLLVALRPRPTLRHFDPERVDYWQTVDERGSPASLDWRIRPAATSDFAWGAIRLVDRLGVANDFVGFGGSLAVTRQSDAMIAVFSSPAPILARGGHSHGWDPTADEVATFLARLRASAGHSRRAEARLAAMTPLALYAAFISAALTRYETAERISGWRPLTMGLLRRERRQLRRAVPAEWQAGEELARGLD